MEVRCTAFGGDGAETLAQSGGWRRGREESIDQCAKIESGAAGDDRQMAALDDAAEGLAGEPAVVSCGAGFVRRDDVDEVVRDHRALFARGLGGAYLHLAVDGDRVATDDLAVEFLRKMQCERGLAAGGWACDYDERSVRHHSRHHPGPKTR